MPTKRSGTVAKKGLSVKTFKGLNKKRMEKQGSGAGIRLAIKQGETVAVQFITDPSEFVEFGIHSWKDGDRWYFVPCAGEACPLDQDEDTKKAKAQYRFATLVYSFRDKQVKLLEGPKDLAGRIFYRYERKPAQFLKRTFEVTKFATTPVSYDFVVGEDDPISATTLKSKAAKMDIEEYLENELRQFWGDDMPDVGNLTSKDDEDDDDVDDDVDDEDDEDEETQEYTLADLRKMKLSKLQEIAEDNDIDTDGMDKSDLIEAIIEGAGANEDEDEEDEEDEEESEDEEDEESEDEDEDDEEDEEEEDEDDEPPARTKKAAKTVKKAPAKKAPAKKAAARRR